MATGKMQHHNRDRSPVIKEESPQRRTEIAPVTNVTQMIEPGGTGSSVPETNPQQYMVGLFAGPSANRRDRGRQQIRQDDHSSYRQRTQSPKRERTSSPRYQSRSPTRSHADDSSSCPTTVRDGPQRISVTPIPEHVAYMDCECPTSYECMFRRSSGLLDCRKLVPDQWRQWTRDLDEESYARQTSYSSQSEPRLVSEARLAEVVVLVNRLETPRVRQQVIKDLLMEIKEWSLEMLRSDVTADALANTGALVRLEAFLDPTNIATRVARHMPVGLEEDLTRIKRKWKKGDFSGNPKRGLTRAEKLDVNDYNLRTTYLVDKNYEHYVSSDYHGAGDLVNGQLYHCRAEMMRDGVHGAPIAGICGNTADGATSIVMGLHMPGKGQVYADVDRGNIIDYEGTALRDTDPDPSSADGSATNVPEPEMNARPFERRPEPTRCTQILMKSFETQKPVRVIRSHGLAPSVSNKPVKGYRYDGLYKVTGMTPQNERRQIWSFRLERLDGQGRLRGFARGEERPVVRGRRYGWKRANGMDRLRR